MYFVSAKTPPPTPPCVENNRILELHVTTITAIHHTHPNTHTHLSPFPNVAEAVQGELNEYKASEEEVMRLKSVMGVSEDDDPDVISGALSDNTAKLTSAIRYIYTFIVYVHA